VTELAANPHGEVCWYFPSTREQYRISGQLQVVGATTSSSSSAGGNNHQQQQPQPQQQPQQQQQRPDLQEARLAAWGRMSAAGACDASPLVLSSMDPTRALWQCRRPLWVDGSLSARVPHHALHAGLHASHTTLVVRTVLCALCYTPASIGGAAEVAVGADGVAGRAQFSWPTPRQPRMPADEALFLQPSDPSEDPQQQQQQAAAPPDAFCLVVMSVEEVRGQGDVCPAGVPLANAGIVQPEAFCGSVFWPVRAAGARHPAAAVRDRSHSAAALIKAP
jgi:hypothetical protein